MLMHVPNVARASHQDLLQLRVEVSIKFT